MSDKAVVVKHGDSLREIAMVHVTRSQSRSLDKEERTDANNHCPMKDETYVAEEGNIGLDTQGEGEMVMGWRERKEVEEEIEEEDESEKDLEEDMPKLRKGNRISAINKDTGEREEWTVLSLAGKRFV